MSKPILDEFGRVLCTIPGDEPDPKPMRPAVCEHRPLGWPTCDKCEPTPVQQSPEPLWGDD